MDLHEQVEKLKAHSEGVKSKLHELKTSSGAAWTELKLGVASAWNDLEAAFHSAHSRMKKK